MQYITGSHALNLPCRLPTTGDWHFSALDWDQPLVRNTDDAFFGTWGVEPHNSVPGQTGVCWVADHVRALLDLLELGFYPSAQGMKDAFICNEALTRGVFEQVLKMRQLPNWTAIDAFMQREYRIEWHEWKAAQGEKIMVQTAAKWTEEERTAHRAVITDFLTFLNRSTAGFVLKGGTSLMLCYGLDRFSEDIDLDSEKQSIIASVRRFCEQRRYEYRVAKDTETVKRCMIRYAGDLHPLKVEVSYRSALIRPELWHRVKVRSVPVSVYRIDEIARHKCRAYLNRDVLRDLHDLCFICREHFDELSEERREDVLFAFDAKGLNQVELLLKTTTDPFVDSDKIIGDFLSAYEKLKAWDAGRAGAARN